MENISNKRKSKRDFSRNFTKDNFNKKKYNDYKIGPLKQETLYEKKDFSQSNTKKNQSFEIKKNNEISEVKEFFIKNNCRPAKIEKTKKGDLETQMSDMEAMFNLTYRKIDLTNPYVFNNKNLEKCWQIHPSFAKNTEFQRLEFLGDKIIAAEVAKIIFKQKNKNEGDLTIQISEMLKGESMFEVGQFLIPQIKYTGVLNKSIVSDCLEAWIGAVYMDGGNVYDIICTLWQDKIFQKFEKSAKNILQEISQEKKIPMSYEFKKIGNEFICTLTFGAQKCSFPGQSKQQCSIFCADEMLRMLKNKQL